MPSGRPSSQQVAEIRVEVDELCRQLLAAPTDPERRKVIGRRLRVLSFVLKRYDPDYTSRPDIDLGAAVNDPELEPEKVAKADRADYPVIDSPPQIEYKQVVAFPMSASRDELDIRLFQNLVHAIGKVDAIILFHQIKGYTVPRISDLPSQPADDGTADEFSAAEIETFNQNQALLRQMYDIKYDDPDRPSQL